MIYYRCKNCDEIISSFPEKAGDADVCPNCGFANQVPSAAGMVRELERQGRVADEPRWLKEPPKRKRHFLLPEPEVLHYCRCGEPMVRLRGRWLWTYLVAAILMTGYWWLRTHAANKNIWMMVLGTGVIFFWILVREFSRKQLWKCKKCGTVDSRRYVRTYFLWDWCVRLVCAAIVFILFVLLLFDWH